MDLQARKSTLIQWLSSLEDSKLIHEIEHLMQYSFKPAQPIVLSPMSEKEYVAMLDEAELAIKNGEHISQEDLEKESENW